MSDPRLVLTICTGNICRSPMAEALLRKHLSGRDLAHVEVRSAGIHAVAGHGAMPEAVVAVERLEGTLGTHVARPLDLVMAREADLLLCATTEHRDRILSWWPDVDRSKVRLFNDAIEGNAPVDVDDPYGWDLDVFMMAARVIDRAMSAWAERISRRWPAA